MLTQWHSITSLAQLSRDVLAHLADEGRAPAAAQAHTFRPAVDMFEDTGALVVKMEIAGMKVKDVGISVENGVLTLHGERKLEKRDDAEMYFSIERSYGTFSRSFTLPDTVDPQKIEASLADGVLTVRLTKKPASKPRKIDIKVS
jgi:HSP20 family protein